MNYDIIIVGAGASGLQAAVLLAEKGFKALVVEARNRTGGRIHTLYDHPFSAPVESGAEFIHGKLEHTLHLCSEAGLKCTVVGGEMLEMRNGKVMSDQAFSEHHDRLMARLSELEHDISVDEFLENHFSGERYFPLRNAVRGFVEGYDGADTSLASAFALRDEWMGDDAEDQYRIDNGYSSLIYYLEQKAVKLGVHIILEAPVQVVEWSESKVQLTVKGQPVLHANRLVLTVPIALLRGGAIRFDPVIPAWQEASGMMGYGSVIKTVLQFSHRFWADIERSGHAGVELGGAGFFFSNSAIPTWWTQLPEQNGMLTGWLGGPKAAAWISMKEEEVLTEAIRSLSALFSMPEPELRSLLAAGRVFNWTADPYTLGAYSYQTVNMKKAIKTLQQPVSDTIFLAGEALYEGKSGGTVEAALVSAINAVQKINR